ncbi:MAG TPA: tyrosine-protein phosphatase [Bacteroidales bacterium]|nr:tyrosine-protein phosphatase [Bacteroidales bacterium]HPY21323.1 tyrosine-protein phosphatase [Bacteroidales bacterium]HQN24294.1 tyrosine-protein phosphatase [Bacteroidales bacterium]HQP79581.1 tyrosine-protein phosphatase [Bacteroidales bacterium]
MKNEVFRMKIKGLKNFRDLGGIRAGKKHIRKGLMFRSEVPVKVPETEMAKLKTEFGIDTIVDLRTSQEIEDNHYNVPEGVEYLHIPIFKESVIGITKEAGSNYRQFIINTRDKEVLRNSIPDIDILYAGILKEDSVVEMTGKAFRQIISNVLEGKATLFHCSWGKDRVGVLASFLLSLLGVGMHDILKDYVFTNRAVKRKAWRDTLLILFFKRDMVVAKKVWRGSIAAPKYLTGLYEGIENDYGSIEVFFREALGISDELRDSFRSAMLI